MADNALREWLDDLVQKHGLADDGDDPQQEYDQLGGDAALLKILAAEDKLFRTNLEKRRLEAMDWQKDRRLELEDRREYLAGRVKEHEQDARRYSASHQREAPLLAPIENRMKALGDKLATETGKELVHLVAKHRDQIEWTARFSKSGAEGAEKARPALALIDLRLQDVDRIYEAVEQRIRDSRTELDNVLELEAMSVEARLERLRGGAAKTLEEARKKLDAEIEKIFKDSVAEDQAQAPYFDESSPDYELGAIDWEPVEKLLAKLESTSPDDLAKADPALAELQEKYDEKGGDEALFEKRVAAWKTTMGAFQMRNKIAADLAGADQLQERLTEARLALGRTEKELAELRAKERETLSRLRELTGGAESGDLLSGREASELQVLAREKKRLETDIANAEKLVPLRERSIENLGELIEKERRRHELQADDEAAPLPPMPRSKDIHELPLRAKYEELSAAS